MNDIIVKNKNAQTVKVINSRNPRSLYEHQIEAMTELNKINKQSSFHSLLVLPTGERVIIVMGAVYAIKSRVSKTLNKYISCIA